MPEGSVVSTTAGLKFTTFKPLLADYVLTMPRGATIVYPKDAAMIVGVADIYPGARVLEAGVGSGALTMSLLRATGPTGKVHSVERRADFAENATANINAYFDGAPENWSLIVGDLQDQEFDFNFDRVVLDMQAPWECVLRPKPCVPGEFFWLTLQQRLSYLPQLKQSKRMDDSPNLKALKHWCVVGTMRVWPYGHSKE